MNLGSGCATIGATTALVWVRKKRGCYNAACVPSLSACTPLLAVQPLLRRYRKLKVLYPGLADAPGHAIAAQQMHGGFGAVLSLQIGAIDDTTQARGLLQHLQLFAKATSFGSTESYVEHRYTIEGAAGGAPANLLRLSIGLEAIEDLIADLDDALRIGGVV